MVKNIPFNEEIRRKDFVGNDTHAFVTENRDQRKSRGLSGHNKSRGISKSRGKIKCYHCGKIGHMIRNCKILKQVDKIQKQEDNKNTTATTYTNDNEVALLCNQEDCCHVAEQDVEWVVDSASSYHCIPKRVYFST